MGDNVLWWSELVGLNDPVENCQTVLSNETVDTIISNIRPMSVEHRTYMLSELIPFLGAFMAELLRAINEAVAGNPDEVVEVPIEDDDQAVLVQVGMAVRNTDRQGDDFSVMQIDHEALVPFGAKLSMLQAHLNGMDDSRSAQAASHLRIMTERLRRLAGDLTKQRRDRFDRLEALIACYHTETVDTPLELQVWCEKQLQVLVTYLGGGAGRAPPPAATETLGCTGAGSSTDVFVVNDSIRDDAEVPEYRVRRTADGEWEPTTAQEAGISGTRRGSGSGAGHSGVQR